MTPALEEIVLDATDRKILVALQQHPEASIAELGEIVGLSQTPCWRRLKRLQEQGAVKERAWILDGQRLGIAVNVFAAVKLRRHDEATLDTFETSIGQIREVVECFSMSGDSDYLLRVVVRDIASYEHILRKVLLHLPEVASINSSFALQTVKLSTQLPI